MTDKKNNRTKYIIFSCFFLIIAISISSIFKSDWDGKGRFSIVLGIDPLMVLSWEPFKKEGIFFVIPPSTKISVPFGYGDYPINSVYRLGNLDKHNRGGELLASSIENEFGIALNGYLIFSSFQDYPKAKTIVSSSTSEEMVQLLKNTFSPIFLLRILSGVESNLTIYDRVKIWNSLRTFRSDQLKFLDLASQNLIYEDNEPDGRKIFRIDKDRFDLVTNGLFQDSAIREENVSVQIINASDQEGLAKKFSRIVEKAGGNVLSIDTAESSQDYSCVISMGSKFHDQLKFVIWAKEVFSCGIAVSEKEHEEVDVMISLGKGFLKW